MIKFVMVSLLAAGVASSGLATAKLRSYRLPEETPTFRSGPGVELAQDNCAACHSADYIAYQPPEKGRAFWEAEVQKMIKVYGAPIGEADGKSITDYLAETY